MNEQEDKIRLRSALELRQHVEGLVEIRDYLQDAGIPYFIGGGTLLGIVRDGSLIPWDWDLEVDFRAEELFPRAGRVLADLRRAGFSVLRYDSSMLNLKLKLEKSGAIYELLGWARFGNFRYRRNYRLPASVFRRASSVSLDGNEFSTFWDPESYLRYQYGDWTTPIRTSDKSVYLTRECSVPPSTPVATALRVLEVGNRLRRRIFRSKA